MSRIIPNYSQYKLTRLFSVSAILSADYVIGTHITGTAHVHRDAWELIICTAGSCRIFCSNSWFTLKAGHAYIVRPNVEHDIGVEDETAKTFVISFVCSGSANLLPVENRILTINSTGNTHFIIEQMTFELTHAFQSTTKRLRLLSFQPSPDSPAGAEQMICCCLEMLLVLLLRDAITQNGDLPATDAVRDSVHSYLVEQVSAYIDLHIHEHLTVSIIAEHFHYSRSRLSILYKEATGKGLGEAITDARISHAKYLMKNCDASVSLASEKAGFCSPQYFSHVFRERTGISPSEYIKRSRLED